MRWLAKLPIRIKLPLAAAGLIVLVAGALSVAAYFAMRRVMLNRATERLATLSTQFQQSFRGSLGLLQSRAIAASSRPALAALLRSGAPVSADSASRLLAFDGAQPELVRRIELRDAEGRVVLSTGKAAEVSLGESDSLPITRVLPSLVEGDSAVFGKLQLDGDSLIYPLAARVPGPPGGYYVVWRRVSNAAQTRSQIAQLLGSEAEFFFGNRDGGLWSDLGRPTNAPPIVGKLEGPLRFVRSDRRGEVLAAAAPVPGTPWNFTVEFPVGAVLTPARNFLRLLVGIAAACVAVSLLVAWLLSRRLVDPLHRLSSAADAIAAGDTSRRVALSREDELGHLAVSFNAMATEVEQSRRRLEETVSARTGELHAVRESLARREKLDLLGHLASGVGHEIRNPLGVMSNAVYYLESILPDGSPEVREYLGILRQQIKVSSKIVNDLLGLTRNTMAHRETVSVQAIVEEQLKPLHLNGARLEKDYEAALPRVLVDPVHAGQIVGNLLTNAVQALGEEHGLIRVVARRLGEAYVRLDVIDDGPGIAPEHRSKIFEPLFTTKARGIGLGLALSKSLAQANGGDLSVVSEFGSGATFSFTIPVSVDSA